MRFIDIYVALFLGVASVSDTRTKKVPNKWILLWIAVGICVRGYKFLTAFLFSLIFTYILYHIKFFGAGDIKIVSVLCGFLGIKAAASLVFTGLCLSAVYAFYYLVSKKILYSRISYFLRYVNSGVRDRTLYKYSESFEKVPTMPMVPWFLLGFLVWRIYEVWMLSMNAMSL